LDSIQEVYSRVTLRRFSAFLLIAGVAAVPAMASRVHRAPTSGHAHVKHHTPTPGAKTTSHKMHGQQAIDSERVSAIQQALIREHYLNGEPSAKWDSDTQAAMLKFQADQGWQTKLTPDSRALIKLGLGPSHSDAINGGSGANFNQLNSPSALPSTSSQGFVAASGVSH
jgi:peptidoglycan hydrolase-like protein with peptidoglycan-binding domain